MPASIAATFARRTGVVLVVTNNGPGGARNVRAEMVEPPPAMPRLVQAPGAPGRDVAALQSFELPVVEASAVDTRRVVPVRWSWEDDTGSHHEEHELPLPA